ncbi:unnamed protein product, partial [marine sediment metagenome]
TFLGLYTEVISSFIFFIIFSSLSLKTKNPFRFSKGRKESIRGTTLIPV